ncbi:MAG: HNH endonuclease [Myxococcales bacterium]
MNDRYRLSGLDDVQLLASLSALVRRENDSLSDLLAHLAELDQREVCVAMGYSSLFAYCTEALGFCKSSAGRRISAARVCRDYPEAFTRVAKGELQLSVLCALRPHLNAENASELFAACARKSYEQVELLLASRFPKPDVRDLIRRLPSTIVGVPDVGSEPAKSQASALRPGLADAIAARGSQQHQQALSGMTRPSAGRGAVKPLSEDRFSVNFTADGEFRELLEEVRALLSHAEPKGDLQAVMKRGLEALRGELLKKKFGVGRKSCRTRLTIREPSAVLGSSAGLSLKRSRHVPAAVAREVYVRDEGRCTFCADDGRRCGERRLLQLDHVIPHAAGGEATVGNLRLRCRAHNLYAARVHFGREHMRVATERGREPTRRAAFDEERLESDSSSGSERGGVWAPTAGE